jgi:phosphatidylglycerophosphate synthase
VNACVLPAPLGGGNLEVAGLSVAERTRRALAHAGFTIVAPGAAARGRTLFVAADAALDPEAARALRDAAGEGLGAIGASSPLEAPAALAVGEAVEGGDALRDATELGALAARLQSEGRLALADLDGAVCERVGSSPSARALERRMLDSLARTTDGFFARHFDRRLSSRLSPHFVRRGVSPNAITLLATIVGLVGAGCLATQAQTLQVIGALLFIASTILDGCDGEVARLSFRSSDFGRRLDLVGDNLVNGAVFAAIAFGAMRSGAAATSNALVVVMLVGFALATVAGYVFARWAERTGRGGDFRALYERLASRDFAYFVLLLAVLDRLHAFLWFASLGTYAFVAVLAIVRVRAGRGPGPPAAPAGEEQWA